MSETSNMPTGATEGTPADTRTMERSGPAASPRETGSEPMAGGDAEPEFETVPVGHLEVKLVFQVGSTEMTLDEFRTLKPGFCFELDQSVEQPVEIRANGKTVGAGTLLNVNGRIGVRVTELLD